MDIECVIREAVRTSIREELRAALGELKASTAPAAYLTIREAAELARVSCDSLRRWIGAGRLTARRAGRELRIERSALEAFLSENIAAPKPSPDQCFDRMFGGKR
jgi:excisionase family DNA binding protein